MKMWHVGVALFCLSIGAAFAVVQEDVQISGGDVAGYVKNVETVLNHLPEGARIIPGHGPLSTKADLVAFLGMLKETTGQIRAAIDAGKSLDAIKAAGLPDKWTSWGTGFINTERWITIVYNSFTR